MPTEIIGMFGVVAGDTQDSLAGVDIPQDGFITGIDWDCRWNMDADAENANAELSFIATNQLTTNDVRGRLSSVGTMMSLTTSGAPVAVAQKFVGPIDIPVAGGERLFLHSVATTGVVGALRCSVHLETGKPAGRRSARRR